jgi:hypothetical protein
MQEKKATSTGWAVGCVAILLLAVVAVIAWCCWWAITNTWVVCSLIACLVLLGLIRQVRLFLLKRKTRQELLQAQKSAFLNAELTTFKARQVELDESLGIPAFDSYPYESKSYLSAELVAALVADGMIVNGNSGGLLIGRAHSQGGVPVIRKLADGSYELWAEFEGYEYIINPGVLTCFPKECEAANQHELDKRSYFAEYVPEPGITVIDVRGLNHPYDTKYLILDSLAAFFIVNKFSTESRLSILEQMNRSVTYEQYLWALEEIKKKANS